jgi:hypothetical protein
VKYKGYPVEESEWLPGKEVENLAAFGQIFFAAGIGRARTTNEEIMVNLSCIFCFLFLSCLQNAFSLRAPGFFIATVHRFI